MPCATCGTDISRFFGKTPMGICNYCKKAYCPNCLKANRTGTCPSCGVKLDTTKSMMKEPPLDWTTQTCPQCQKKLPKAAQFCDSCGYRFGQPLGIPAAPKQGLDWKSKLILIQFGVIGLLILALVLVVKYQLQGYLIDQLHFLFHYGD